MTMAERTGYRSLIYSGWHRPSSVARYLGAVEAASLTMIDVDCCEYCARCGAPLALIETAQTTNAPKSARVTARLARSARLRAFSVSYSGCIERARCDTCGGVADTGDVTRFAVQRVEPPHPQIGHMDPTTYARFLLSLRDDHRCSRGES